MKKTSIVPLMLGIVLIGAAVTGCGTSKQEIMETTKQETAETTDIPETANVIKPLYPLENPEDALADGGYSVFFEADDLVQKDDGCELMVKVYEYDRYEPEDMEHLREGAQIQFCRENVVVESAEKNEDTGLISINGGLENGGIDLCEDDGLYRTIGMDDYPIYYEIGDIAIPLSEELQFVDHSDLEAEPDGNVYDMEGFRDVLESGEGIFNCTNTVIMVRQGEILQVIRYWTP